MTAFARGDKVILTHDSVAGQTATYIEPWYDGQAACVEFADGHRQVINIAHVRPTTAEEIASA